ncbi:MAG: hypothetical protein GC154_19000 [bacterium]|nr:hypothetical protein [bacterium]
MSLSATRIAALTAVSAAEGEAALIAVIESKDSSRKEIADACRELARVGTKKSVKPLAALLGSAEHSHMARYGLETIADSSVDSALRSALSELKGLQRIGVIGSLGVRKDGKAVKALAGLLSDSYPVTVQAAARALGSIGGSGASKALLSALGETSGQNQLAVSEGLFRCAEGFAASGDSKQAKAIYAKLASASEFKQVERAAKAAM